MATMVLDAHALMVLFNDEPGSYYQYSFANCCNPVQGDKIFGFVLVQGGVKIHRATCPNANNLLAQYSHRILNATWGNTSKSDFLSNITAVGNARSVEMGVIVDEMNDVRTGCGLD